MRLMWGNTSVGIIDKGVQFDKPFLNSVVYLYTKGRSTWSKFVWESFLADRVISENRKDIQKILAIMNLPRYDINDIALLTRAINPKDMFWISLDLKESYEDTVLTVMNTYFLQNRANTGSLIHSPNGVNKKNYYTDGGNFGLLKERLHPYSHDIESEVAVYELSKLLGVNVCPSWFVEDTRDRYSFSKYMFNYANEYVVHVSNFFNKNERGCDEYTNLKMKFPQFINDIRKMVLLDFITRQTDRHLSNMSITINTHGMYFYPLYDNGRSLFQEEKPEFIADAVRDIELYSSEFGEVGTYYDAVKQITKECNIKDLVNLEIEVTSIRSKLVMSKIPIDRLDGICEWVTKSIDKLKRL